MSRSFFGTRLHQVFCAWTSGDRRKELRSKLRRSPRVEFLEGRCALDRHHGHRNHHLGGRWPEF